MVVCPFVLVLFVIVSSVLLRFIESDYTFGIFKLFLENSNFSTIEWIYISEDFLIA
jgi:hypothetical protein